MIRDATRRFSSKAFCLLACALLTSQSTFAAPIPEGPSFPLNGDVALAADGTFAAFFSRCDLGDFCRFESGYFQRYTATGSPLGPALKIGGNVFGTSLAADPTGGYVLVWDELNPLWVVNEEVAPDPGAPIFPSRIIYAYRLDATGKPKDKAPIVVNLTTDAHSGATVAARDDGAFVVLWSGLGALSVLSPEKPTHAYARGFSSAGLPYSREFQLSNEPDLWALTPRAVFTADHRFVAVWDHRTSDEQFRLYPHGVYMRRCGIAGVNLDPVRRVDVDGNGADGYGGVVAGNAQGKFVIAWSASNNVYALRFANADAPLDSHALRVNAAAAGGSARTGIDADGRTVFGWTEPVTPDWYAHSYGRRFDRNGVAMDASDFLLDDAASQSRTAVFKIVGKPDGAFLVSYGVWSGPFEMRGRWFKKP